jgi:hypothetical protein
MGMARRELREIGHNVLSAWRAGPTRNQPIRWVSATVRRRFPSEAYLCHVKGYPVSIVVRDDGSC